MPKITIQKNNDGQNNNWGFTVTVTGVDPPYTVTVNAPGTGPDEESTCLNSDPWTFSRNFEPPKTVTVVLRKNGEFLDSHWVLCD